MQRSGLSNLLHQRERIVCEEGPVVPLLPALQLLVHHPRVHVGLVGDAAAVWQAAAAVAVVVHQGGLELGGEEAVAERKEAAVAAAVAAAGVNVHGDVPGLAADRGGGATGHALPVTGSLQDRIF